MPYTEIRSGLWQELSFFSSVFSAESNSMGLCLKAVAHSPNCCQMNKYKSPSCFNASLLSLLFLIVSRYSDWLLKHVRVWAVMYPL